MRSDFGPNKGETMIRSILLLALLLPAALPSEARAGPVRIADFKFECVTPAGQRLKPQFGDMDGMYYSEIAGNEDACAMAVKSRIANCHQHTRFLSPGDNRKYPDCLPIFRSQAAECAAHFRRQRSKCDGERDINIAGFTGFGCEVTATGVEEGDEPGRGPGIAPTDRREAAGSRDPAQQGGGPAAQLSPKCAGMDRGAQCWNELSNRPGCYIFEPYYDPPMTATWSGDCAGGAAVGHGTWEWQASRNSGESTGTLVRGRPDGRWVFRFAGGTAGEASYMNGKLHGRWVIRFARGGAQEGPYVDGKPHGRWVYRWANGNVEEGPYVNGERHGRWVFRYANGGVGEGPYVDGKQHGRWVFRYANGSVNEGPIVNGKRHGRWVARWANGRCAVLRYSHGKEKRPRSRC